jgi:hypothetical protein
MHHPTRIKTMWDGKPLFQSAILLAFFCQTAWGKMAVRNDVARSGTAGDAIAGFMTRAGVAGGIATGSSRPTAGKRARTSPDGRSPLRD